MRAGASTTLAGSRAVEWTRGRGGDALAVACLVVPARLSPLPQRSCLLGLGAPASRQDRARPREVAQSHGVSRQARWRPPQRHGVSGPTAWREQGMGASLPDPPGCRGRESPASGPGLGKAARAVFAARGSTGLSLAIGCAAATSAARWTRRRLCHEGPISTTPNSRPTHLEPVPSDAAGAAHGLSRQQPRRGTSSAKAEPAGLVWRARGQRSPSALLPSMSVAAGPDSLHAAHSQTRCLKHLYHACNCRSQSPRSAPSTRGPDGPGSAKSDLVSHVISVAASKGVPGALSDKTVTSWSIYAGR